jgi:hypothetical protein
MQHSQMQALHQTAMCDSDDADDYRAEAMLPSTRSYDSVHTPLLCFAVGCCDGLSVSTCAHPFALAVLVV